MRHTTAISRVPPRWRSARGRLLCLQERHGGHMRIVHSLEELLDLPADQDVNGFRRREALQLEIPTLTHHALTDAQDALNSLQERGGSLVAAGIMFVALICGV